MLYASQPLNQSITPRVGRRNMASEQGAMGRGWGAALPCAKKGDKPTWEIRRSDERLKGPFEVGKREGLGRDALEQGWGCFWRAGEGGRKERGRQKESDYVLAYCIAH